MNILSFEIGEGTVMTGLVRDLAALISLGAFVASIGVLSEAVRVLV
jgi:hypothetical protein